MKVNIAGDFAPVLRVKELIDRSDFATIFNDVISVNNNVDLSILNLELPLTNSNTPIQKTGPALKASVKSVEAIKYGGFSLVTLANNHIFDYGITGLRDTFDVLQTNNIAHVGAGANNREARKPYYFEKSGKRLAIISIAENEWSTTHSDEYGANPLNEIDNYYDITEAKESADYVLVIVHAGHEQYQLPTPRIKKLFRFFIDAGADAVIGHHTHAYSGYEIYNSRPIVYSLGNFVFDWKTKIPFWNEGIIAQLDFGETIEMKIIPIIQNDEQVGVRLMTAEQRGIFERKIEALNSIIADDNMLKAAYLNFLQTKRDIYISYIQPYSNRYIYRLKGLGLFPKNIWSEKRQNLLINIIRCETHREAILNTLQQPK